MTSLSSSRYLSVDLQINLFICLYRYICLTIHITILSVRRRLSIYLPNYLPLYQSLSPHNLNSTYIYFTIYLSNQLFNYLIDSIYQSVHPHISYLHHISFCVFLYRKLLCWWWHKWQEIWLLNSLLPPNTALKGW